MIQRIASSVSGKFKKETATVLPVNGGDNNSNNGGERNSSFRRSGSRRSSERSSGRMTEGLSRSLSNIKSIMARKPSSSKEDLDKSDVSTRNQHKVVYRSDGRPVIRAMNSSNDVVRKFKLRSNSVIENEGALQAALTEVENKKLREEAQRKGLIMPNDPNLKAWRLFMLAMTFWQVFFAPWNWAFNPELSVPVEWFEHFSDLTFLVDFVLKFLMTKKDEKTGLLITKKSILWMNYLKGWFFLDLITCFPLDKLALAVNGRSWYEKAYLTQLNKMGRALRFYRCIEMYKIIEHMDHASTSWFFFSSAAHYLKLGFVVVATLVFVHYGGCMWYATAWVGGDDGWNFWKQRSFCVATYQDEGFSVNLLADLSLQPLPPTITTRLNRMYDDLNQLRSQDECMDDGEGQQVWDEYTNSLLASLLLFLTGENLEPVTDHEKVVQSMYLLMGIFVIALLYGNVHALVSNILMRSSNYQRKMETIYDAMNRMNLPKSLQDRIFYYYDYLHKEHGTLNGSVIGFVPEVSKKLQAEVYLWQRFNLIKSVKFFENIHPKVIQDIVVELQVEVFLPGDYIISHDDYGDSMYFIYTGQCEVIVPMSKEELEKESYERRKSTDAGMEGNEGRRKSSVSNMLSNLVPGRRPSTSNVTKTTIAEGEDEDRVSDSSRDSGGRVSAQNSRRATAVAIGAMNSAKTMLSRANKQPQPEVKKKQKVYKIVATLRAGQYFGEVALVLHSKRTASIRSKGCCEVCVLTKGVYDRVAQEYPADAWSMRNIILQKYGNLDHTRKTIVDANANRLSKEGEAEEEKKSKRESPKSKRESSDNEKEVKEGTPQQRPSMAGKTANSSTSTTPSTPSTNLSRANSSLRSIDSSKDPDSPTRNLKLAADNFKVDLRGIDQAYDTLIDGEIMLTQEMEDLGVELHKLLEMTPGVVPESTTLRIVRQKTQTPK
ncbi:hypothetical protein TL16_g01680 [Triparma laevis f. inornata]|uniref:Cyclic nucleotide-binding domain-containing protein n=1 Tax=Triparma laevis f. inornata TaxID=1714386 RepID=A0A9W6ZNG6_9STRA|nr:hypothetical protein TL16_g01680 [Triparma laevis f. inornata]